MKSTSVSLFVGFVNNLPVLMHCGFVTHTEMLIADDRNAIRACDQISDLVDGLSTFLNPNCLQRYSIPQYLTRPVRSVIVGQSLVHWIF